MVNTIEGQQQEEEKYLQFSCGNELYAVPLLKVREVIGVPQTTPTPYSPDYFLGIMNLRGQVISIVDLCKKLRIPYGENREENAVIIVEIDDILLGLQVDSVDRVVIPQSDSFTESDSIKSSKKSQFITGVFRVDEQLIVLFDVEKMLSQEDIHFATKKGA